MEPTDNSAQQNAVGNNASSPTEPVSNSFQPNSDDAPVWNTSVNNNQSNGTKKQKKSALSSIAIVLTVLILGGILCVVFWSLGFIKIGEQNTSTENEPDTSEEAETTEEKVGLPSMVKTICGGEYDVVLEKNEDTGIFQCKKSKEIYSVLDTHEEKIGDNYPAQAAYIGTTYDSTVDKYFKNDMYVYRHYPDVDKNTDLILLVASDSEDGVVEKYAESIFDYIEDAGAKSQKGFDITIFYNDSLDSVMTARDYVMISVAIGIYSRLPNGSVMGKYWFGLDTDLVAVRELAGNPDLYSSQTRNAIKNNRHIKITINKDDSMTREKLVASLKESFVDGN